MPTKFLNLSTDTTLGGSAPSDTLAVSQKAIKTYVDNHGGGGSVAIDNSTITKNASDEIQAVAVIDQNTGIAKTWTGTQAEYEAIVTKDPETEYIITDDIGGSATVIAELAEGLNDKADVSTVAHVVTEFQEPTSANNYTWYRKYADGWVEQGGIQSLSGGQNANIVVNIPLQMSNTNYAINCVAGYPGSGDYTVTFGINTNSITTTSFAFVKHWSSTSGVCYWQVSGMAA